MGIITMNFVFMPIFQTSVLKKFLKQQDDVAIAKAYKAFTSFFHNAEIQQNIKDSKEEQFQAKFLDELFVTVLGYTLSPQPSFNLTTEFKNIKNSRKADGAVLRDEKAIAVIELKSTKTKDLESIRQQAFDYKANQPECVYVITSNFEKIRFYINNAVDFEEFDLFTLSQERFKLLYLCLHKDNLLNDVPLKIKEASIVEEESITKKFYADYSLFRRELYRDMVKRNSRNAALKELTDTSIKKALFNKTQKLLDRFLFVLFGEDRGLLPPNSIPEILKQWEKLKDLDAYVPLYERYKKYFGYLNTGWKGKDHDIFAYNGGLFKPDPLLDSIEIDDELLFKHTSKLTAYDFESQVDVNILGHIFEHSLNEIESVNAEIEGVEFDKQKTKRKKDGVFYTPKYITKYIVDNTVGKLCEDKKTELGIAEENYLKGRKNRPKDTVTRLNSLLDTYREWMLTLTICDPACGSGAFLNQALDFLIAEHQWIDEMRSKLMGGGLAFPDIENSILEKNIYGVDLNEESVEIAKLSLWLRTSQPGRKLTSLNNNIKCGNSLIESKAVAGDKAFVWEKEFPEVFAKGGFDVVIGNPPYVRQEILTPYKPYFEEHFKTYAGTADLYTYFIEMGVDGLIKEEGIYSIIVGNKWMRARFATKLRQWMKEKEIVELVDFGDLPVFENVAAYPVIVTLKKPTKKNDLFYACEPKDLHFDDLKLFVHNNRFQVDKVTLHDDAWALQKIESSMLLKKLRGTGTSLENFIDRKMYVGLKTGLNAAFIIDSNTYADLVTIDPRLDALIKPYVVGRDIKRYGKPTIDKYLICIPNKWTNAKGNFDNEESAWNWFQSEYPSLANLLEPFAEKAKKRTDKGEYWWELRACEYYTAFEKAKIIYSEIASEGRFTIDRTGVYCDMTAFIIGTDSSYLLAILNSKVFTYLFKHSSSEIRGGFLRWKRQYMYPLPIPKPDKMEVFSNMTDSISELNGKKHELASSFLSLIQSRYDKDKLPQHLNNWYSMDFRDFQKELKKAKIKLSLGEEAEWIAYFHEQKEKVQNLQSQIDQTDRKIDQIVYELYGLSEEEIKIVEGSL